MICSYCSAEMPEISEFCPGCGRPVKTEAAIPEDAVPSVAPLGLEALLAAVGYLSFIPAIVLLLIPQFRAKRFLRFHAWQSLLFCAAAAVSGVVTRILFAALALFPFVGYLLAWILAGLVSLALFFSWLLLLAKAALGESYELPWIGPYAARLSSAPPVT